MDASLREAARPLKYIADRSWQLLLREVTSESLLQALWYLKDIEIAKAVVRNMSLRAASMTVEDLIAKFHGRNPDNLPQEEWLVKGGRDGLKEVLTVLNRLMSEGQIETIA